MKKLFFLRHANAANSVPDFNRKLNEVGINKCKELATILAPYSDHIDYILSSSSTRTSQTISISLPNNIVHFDYDCYNASLEQLLVKLKEIDSKYNFTLLVGHNPHISELTSLFSGKIITLSPGGLALFDCNIDFWYELGLSNIKLIKFWP
jgi:phosphohistidine phosphatase SixA